MKTLEIWRPIKGYEGRYEVSSYGRVRSTNRQFTRKGYIVNIRGKVLSPGTNCDGGYLFVNLCRPGFKRKGFYIHRLVAAAFLSNPDNLKEVNHKDRNTQNNNVSNLEWCTRQYNTTYLDAHKKRGVALRRPILVYNPNETLYREFESCEDAALHFGVLKDTIYRYLAGKHKNQYGFTFKYK